MSHAVLLQLTAFWLPWGIKFFWLETRFGQDVTEESCLVREVDELRRLLTDSTGADCSLL